MSEVAVGEEYPITVSFDDGDDETHTTETYKKEFHKLLRDSDFTQVTQSEHEDVSPPFNVEEEEEVEAVQVDAQ